MDTKKTVLLALALVGATLIGAARAGDRCDLLFTNSLSEEIVAIRVKYATPYEAPDDTRSTSSQVFLRPDANYRIGVQGTTRPLQIGIDLTTKFYFFDDLSGLNPTNDMRLDIAHEDGKPVLKLIDEEARAVGAERDVLTVENRPNAVDRDYLTGAKTFAEVEELAASTAADARERLGELKEFTVEAGPIWNNDHARIRCPEAAAEWSAANNAEARWNGSWTTTIPGEMSVCGCATGTAGLDKTLFAEDAGWGKTLYLPLSWKGRFGVARVQAMDRNAPEEGIGFDLRFRIPETGVDEMIDDLQSDLRVDDFRPWSFSITTWKEGDEERNEVEISFAEGDLDKYDAQDKMQELLFAAYAESSLVEATAAWVQLDAFDKLKAGQDPDARPGVMVMFSPGAFEAVFIPDGRLLAQ